MVWCGVVGIGYHCLLTLVWWVALACRRGNRPFLSPVIIDLQSRMKYPGMHLQRFHSICLQLIINFQCTTCLRYLHEGHFSFSLYGHYQSCVIRIRCIRIHHRCSNLNSLECKWLVGTSGLCKIMMFVENGRISHGKSRLSLGRGSVM